MSGMKSGLCLIPLRCLLRTSPRRLLMFPPQRGDLRVRRVLFVCARRCARGISCVCLSCRAAVLSLSRLKWINRSVCETLGEERERGFFFFFFFFQRPSRKTQCLFKHPLTAGLFLYFLFFSFGTSNHLVFFFSVNVQFEATLDEEP